MKIKFLSTLSLTLVFFKLGYGQSDIVSKDSLTIMTFNCEFMWDGIDPEEGRVEFDHKGSPEKCSEKMRAIAEIIKRNNPDVINLVEVEGLQAVEKLNNQYLSEEGYSVYFVKGSDGFTGQDVALLSRHNIDSIKRYKNKGQSGNESKAVSKNYYAVCEIGKLKLAFIGLHFLSRPNDNSRLYSRQAQADAIRDISVKLSEKGYNIIAMGDFNDYDGDSLCLDINDNKPISNVLGIMKEMNPDIKTDDLFNVSAELVQSERYTAHWDKNSDHKYGFPDEVSSIDHILISETLKTRLGYVHIDHTHNPLETSDHFPVIIRIAIN